MTNCPAWPCSLSDVAVNVSCAVVQVREDGDLDCVIVRGNRGTWSLEEVLVELTDGLYTEGERKKKGKQVQSLEFCLEQLSGRQPLTALWKVGSDGEAS